MNIQTIAVDFDGTLCTDKFPEIGTETTVFECVRTLKSLGYKVILWTCRRDQNLSNAVMWCRDRGLIFDAVNSNLPENIAMYNGDTRKVCADVYIDDKSMIGSENPIVDITNYLHKLIQLSQRRA